MTDKTRIFEISAAVFTGVLKFLLIDIFNYKFIFIVFTILFWGCYIIYKKKKYTNIMKEWGFTLTNLRKVFAFTSIFALISFIIIGTYSYLNSSLHLNSHIIFVLLTYPIWGTIQQFLTMSLIAGNLNHLEKVKISKPLIILITATVFSLVHYPSFLLILGTFIMAIFYAYLYLKFNNLYPLGLYHGWIGGLFYFFILNRDPWLEFIKILK